MRAEYEVLRDALITIYETSSGLPIGYLGTIDDDDLVDLTITAVEAQKDALNEMVDEVTEVE